MRPRDILKVLAREVRVGLSLGLLLGTLGFLIGSWAYGNDIGAVIGLTLLAICTMAATVGGAMPLIGRTVGVDPAVFSNPSSPPSSTPPNSSSTSTSPKHSSDSDSTEPPCAAHRTRIHTSHACATSLRDGRAPLGSTVTGVLVGGSRHRSPWSTQAVVDWLAVGPDLLRGEHEQQ
ncbi:MAG: magnesium transporter, partial [Dermatophilaceae bacterium]